jgi:hypothetical protein
VNVSVSPEAQQELIDGAIFYSERADKELGLAFIAEFEHGEICVSGTATPDAIRLGLPVHHLLGAADVPAAVSPVDGDGVRDTSQEGRSGLRLR